MHCPPTHFRFCFPSSYQAFCLHCDSVCINPNELRIVIVCSDQYDANKLAYSRHISAEQWLRHQQQSNIITVHHHTQCRLHMHTRMLRVTDTSSTVDGNDNQHDHHTCFLLCCCGIGTLDLPTHSLKHNMHTHCTKFHSVRSHSSTLVARSSRSGRQCRSNR